MLHRPYSYAPYSIQCCVKPSSTPDLSGCTSATDPVFFTIVWGHCGCLVIYRHLGSVCSPSLTSHAVLDSPLFSHFHLTQTARVLRPPVRIGPSRVLDLPGLTGELRVPGYASDTAALTGEYLHQGSLAFACSPLRSDLPDGARPAPHASLIGPSFF